MKGAKELPRMETNADGENGDLEYTMKLGNSWAGKTREFYEKHSFYEEQREFLKRTDTNIFVLNPFESAGKWVPATFPNEEKGNSGLRAKLSAIFFPESEEQSAGFWHGMNRQLMYKILALSEPKISFRLKKKVASKRRRCSRT